MLLKELSLYADELSDNTIDTIYFGGGTPSSLPLSMIEQILNGIRKYCKLSDDCEISMEVNPSSVDGDYLIGLHMMGINRISIGAQAFQQYHLEAMGRSHHVCDIGLTVDMVRNVGIHNISIDLMYGLPGHTMEEWQESLRIAISLPITHISIYGLMLSDNSPWGRLLNDGFLEIASDELSYDMQIYAMEYLDQHMFEHYEISNYAKAEYRCRHNMNYWTSVDYLGLGLNASSYINGIRYRNTVTIKDYNKLLENNEKPIYEKEILAQDVLLTEDIFLGLRLKSGLNLDMIRNKYNIDILEDKHSKIDFLIDVGYVFIENNHLKLTKISVPIASEIILQIM